jgi:hypothetical protein
MQGLRYPCVGTATFRVGDENYTVSAEDGRWVVDQLRMSRGAAAAISAAEKLVDGLERGTTIETTLEERRELVGALDRGSSKARSRDLRRFEIGLRTLHYAETYFGAEE